MSILNKARNIINHCTLLTFLILIKSDGIKSNSDYNEFLNSDFAKLPKCCAPKLGLIRTSTSMFCSAHELQYTHFELFSTKIATNSYNDNPRFSDICGNLSCVDFLYDEQKWSLVWIQNCKISTYFNNYIYFPKCCPNDYVYDPVNHTCVKRKFKEYTYLFGGNTQVLNVSLSHCPRNYALVDYQTEKFVLNKTDKSVRVGNTTLKYQSYCIDRNVNNEINLIRACLPYNVVCGTMKKRCLKKCCPDGEIYLKRDQRPGCNPYYTFPFNVTHNKRFTPSDNDFGIIFSSPGNKYIANSENKFHIDEVGNFIVSLNKERKTMNPTEALYCNEGWLNPKHDIESHIFLLITADPNRAYRTKKYLIQGYILGVSTLFMMLTAVCYMFIPVLQNLHGRCMFMFCTIMSASSAMLCCVQLQIITFNHYYCIHTGFVIYYLFLGSFAWMNVVCFDMWTAFGSMKTCPIQKEKDTCKKFFYYSLYGIGVPTLIVGFACIVYITECLPYPFVPHIGLMSCYFEKRDDTYDYIIYFLIPASLMLLANLILFIKTTRYCYKVKKEIQRMQNSTRTNNVKKKNFFDDKETLKMLFKIFLVMGIPWTFECISSIISLHDSPTMLIIEAVGDYINSGQGIIIFCLLILKQRICKSVKSVFVAPVSRFSLSESSSKSNKQLNRNTSTFE